ncbi:hypothetical protein J2Z18_006222 [Paenibacillus lactis]|uniref:Uncharacterized protein n=1 Tax=Paenibacillus lactis TaxID=228574 RepID=A0ABS4FLB7_9BACL|nr:hypothetical protein [Paenibacillus lactis]
MINVMNSFILWFLSQSFVIYAVFVPVMAFAFVSGIISIIRWRR